MEELEQLFTCRQCGFCCHGETTVSLNAADQQRMIDYLQLPREEVARRYWRVSGSVVQMRIVDHHCIFYDNGCTIYHGRPWRCAQWPLVPALLIDEANFQAISASCPGLSREISYRQFCRILERVLAGQPSEEEMGR